MNFENIQQVPLIMPLFFILLLERFIFGVLGRYEKCAYLHHIILLS